MVYVTANQYMRNKRQIYVYQDTRENILDTDNHMQIHPIRGAYPKNIHITNRDVPTNYFGTRMKFRIKQKQISTCYF